MNPPQKTLFFGLLRYSKAGQVNDQNLLKILTSRGVMYFADHLIRTPGILSWPGLLLVDISVLII